MTTGCGALCAPHPVASHSSLLPGWESGRCWKRGGGCGSAEIAPAHLCQALQPAIAVICSHVSPTAQSSASPASTPAS